MFTVSWRQALALPARSTARVSSVWAPVPVTWIAVPGGTERAAAPSTRYSTWSTPAPPSEASSTTP
jgi:hypothetical protein